VNRKIIHTIAGAALALALMTMPVGRAGAEAQGCDWAEKAFWEQAQLAAQVDRCIAAGADPNARDQYGWTPLHQVARYGTPETVAVLLKAGADLEARSNRAGWTPLHHAARQGTPETVAALIDAGADFAARTKNGNTPLQLAAAHGKLENVEVLRAAGADPKVLKTKQNKVKAKPNNWRISTETSPLDDSTSVFLRTSGTPIRGPYGEDVIPTLHIRCVENRTAVTIYFGGHFMSDHRHGRVDYRIDDTPARHRQFRGSNNHEYLGLWRGTGIGFIKSLFGHDKLYVRATPYSESSVSTTFRIGGLEDAIRPLRHSCNW